MMNRKPEQGTPPEVTPVDRDGWVKETRTYKIITPLFGGGEEPLKADSITTVRASEVRGHLRFWWRACKAAEYSSIAEMQQEEAKIWGSTESPSEVAVSIRPVAKDSFKREPAFQVVKENDKKKTKFSSKIAPYAAFPLQPDKNEEKLVGWKSEDILLDIIFELEIKHRNDPELIKNVEAALWAWETFGGIGARTRRGFGAIQCVNKNGQEVKAPKKGTVGELIQSGLKAHVSGKSCELAGVPYLKRKPRHRAIEFDTKEILAWKSLIQSLKKFRQSRFSGDHQLSHWPEANEIRSKFGKEPNLPDGADKESLVHKFPRAKLGLPILFHMPRGKGLPDSINLQGIKINEKKSIDRLASPLILRPIACSDGSIGLATILEWLPVQSDETYTPPGGLVLEGVPKDRKVFSDLDDDEASKIPPLDNNPDVLQAFLDTLK